MIVGSFCIVGSWLLRGAIFYGFLRLPCQDYWSLTARMRLLETSIRHTDTKMVIIDRGFSFQLLDLLSAWFH